MNHMASSQSHLVTLHDNWRGLDQKTHFPSLLIQVLIQVQTHVVQIAPCSNLLFYQIAAFLILLSHCLLVIFCKSLLLTICQEFNLITQQGVKEYIDWIASGTKLN